MIRRSLTFALCLAVPVTFGLAGCGGGGGGGGGGGTGSGGGGSGGGSKPSVTAGTPTEKSGGGESAKPEASADAAGAEEGWGTITGQIVLDGTAPEPTPLVKKGDPEAKDAAVCAVEGVMSEEIVVNKDNNGLRWVLVYLGGKPKIHPDLKEPKGEAVIGQKGCHFIPHVVAMRQGQKFVITSDDPVAHNTKGDGIKNAGFNPVVPPAAEGKQSRLDGPELVAENLPMSISCSIHPWMKAYLGVYSHPYFAVTDENGKFTIENVPAGELKLMTWHESGGYGEGGKDGKGIKVKAGESLDVGQIKYKPKPK